LVLVVRCMRHLILALSRAVGVNHGRATGSRIERRAQLLAAEDRPENTELGMLEEELVGHTGSRGRRESPDPLRYTLKGQPW
jgi:hypothetical protein